MSRALRYLVLLSALFVVAVRCLSGFPLARACVEVLPEAVSVELCPTSDVPASEDTLAPVALDDDSDDGADPLVTPALLHLVVLGHGEVSGTGRGILVAQRALPSHAPNLERPPRA